MTGQKRGNPDDYMGIAGGGVEVAGDGVGMVGNDEARRGNRRAAAR